MTLGLARAAFGALCAALLVLTASACAGRLAAKPRRDWWITDRWTITADACELAGRVLLYAAAVLLGLAAFPAGS